ncbi:MAG: glycosyltransferase, partial [Aquificota bacterium]|nr:glycosyltransferase [Aquificota bacterium]
MLEAFAYFLLGFQIFILVYFTITNTIYTFFILVSLFYLARHALIVYRENLEMMISNVLYRPISIIIPAYNEEETIVPSIKSLLRLHYPEFELIVVNDGSTDGTLDRLKESFRLIRIDRPVRLILRHRPVRGLYV